MNRQHSSSMRLLSVIAAGLALSSPATAQMKAASLGDRIAAIDAKTLTAADCGLQVASAAKANAPSLIYGGRICAAVKMPLEASFLMLAGQLRAASDIQLLPPATQSDDRSLMPLYGILYFGGGLNGVDDDVLHDPVERARFLDLVDRWSPFYGADYEPGWTARKRPDAATYATMIAQAKAVLRKNLDRLVRLDSDDQYYALQSQYNQILARIPASGGLAPDTPDGKLFDGLQKRMRARGIAIGVDMGPPPPNPKDLAVAATTTAESSADFPPASPGKGESIVSASADPAMATCVDQAERMAVASGARIERKQIYSSARWGAVLRADITGGDVGTERYTCTETFTGTQPFDFGKLRPLPE